MPSDKDLVAARIPPKSSVEELLNSAEDLPASVAQFQKDNSLNLTPLHSVLKVFDLHDQRRFDFHQTVISALADKLAQKIRELGARKRPEETKKLEALLSSLFKLHDIPEVRPIVLEALRQVPKVSSKILKNILNDKSLYEETNFSVKQQIWLIKEHLHLFVEAAEKLLDSYVEDKEKIMTTVTRSSSHFFNCETSKSRRQWKQVRELISMIGLHEKLYRRLIDLIRDRFVETRCPHYCSLRLEIVMAIHDINVDYVVQIDPCHDFVWVLHAIVRDRHFDNQQTTKLKGLLDKKKIMEPNLKDMSMVSADPHVLFFLGCSAIRVLNENARQCTVLPRESFLLQVVVRLLYLGTLAVQIISEGIREQKAVVNDCVTRFLPLLLGQMAADRFRAELQRAPADISNEFIVNYPVGALDTSLVEFVQTDVVPAVLFFSYVLDSLGSKRRLPSAHLLTEYLRVICETKDQIVMQDPWAHLLTARLTQSLSAEVLFADPEFVHYVVQFYTIGVKLNANNRFHVLRICNTLNSQLPDEVVEKLMTIIDPSAGPMNQANPSAAQRFEKEFRRLVFLRAREPSPTPQTSVELPIVAEAPVYSIVDPLSQMLFDE